MLPSPGAAREVRLAAGGAPPRSWEDLSTAELKVRWASALGFARRTRAVPPSEEAGAAIIAIAELLDRRGVLLPEVIDGTRAERVGAAGARLHITGTIAHAAGMPQLLRDATTDDAAATVQAVWDPELTAPELLAAGADTWSHAELSKFLRAAVPPSGEERPSTAVPDDEVSPPVPSGRGVVDISLPRPTGSLRRGSRARR